MTSPAPAYDNKIYQKYSKKSLQNKEKNKIAFCQDFGLKYDKKVPLLCLTYPLTEKNNLDMLQDVINGLLEQNVALVLTGIGTEKFQDFFTKLAEEYPKRVVIVSDNEDNKRKVYAASDIFLCTCTDKECLEEMENAMHYGVVPISPECEITTDYDGSKEEGNAFIYTAKSPWSFFASLIRALENFKFPYDWKQIQGSTMDGEEEDENLEE